MEIVGVLGAGAMGSGITQVAAAHGHKVVVCDNLGPALKRSSKNLKATLAGLVEKGKMTVEESEALQGRITYTDHMSEFRDCDIVIEAIVEDLEIKQIAFKSLEAMVSEKTILASNTSSLSISAICAQLQHPERALGIHFFNPAPVMRLVEIIPALQTEPYYVDKARALISRWGKTTVLAKDTPGFIVNRVARPYYGEALRILDEGIADAPTIDWAMRTFGGFRMGPFELMDFIGNDINYTVTETVFHSFYYDPRYKPSFTQKRLVDAHYLGRKTGRGFYDYREGAVNPEPTKDEMLGKQIFTRIVCMLINEAADAYYLRIASRDDIDLAMTHGMNYPKGLLAWADEIGIPHIVEHLDWLHAEYCEDRYRCCRLLRIMARERRTFY
ncbi:MAG: 3-hydroxyacyl-CoA dehydrogenase NAD-binding domain-containing protein [Saprospiraceae bacterium]|nr:3-hydroxyacyl-CoA dehydrogenase NAD-binding domain-containing protein [Saprospiraceae bacterium]MDW8229114.1 3-hydroxyacyl-CoA dehydrogenase NAD-binding domain-containing protein [Saprospiraceae bacterium]